MLTKTELLRRTAEFFKLNPDRWVKNKLHVFRDGKECYCTVGYAAKVLRDAGIARGGDDYTAVSSFLGIDSDRLVKFNDGTAQKPEDVVEFLTDEIAPELV